MKPAIRSNTNEDDTGQHVEVEKQRRISQRVDDFLKNPDWLWEALGPDGMSGLYPEHIRRTFGKSEQFKREMKQAQRAIEDYHVLMIGRAVKAGDVAAVGRLVISQLQSYAVYSASLQE